MKMLHPHPCLDRQGGLLPNGEGNHTEVVSRTFTIFFRDFYMNRQMSPDLGEMGALDGNCLSLFLEFRYYYI